MNLLIERVFLLFLGFFAAAFSWYMGCIDCVVVICTIIFVINIILKKINQENK